MPSPLVPDKIEDELEMTMVCHRPEGLEQLEAQTNFTKRELQVLYRGFKNVRPAASGGLPKARGPIRELSHLCLDKRKVSLQRGRESKTTWLERLQVRMRF